MVARSSSVRVIAHLNPSQVAPLLMYGEVTGCPASNNEVGKCSTRGGSWGMYITFAPPKK